MLESVYHAHDQTTEQGKVLESMDRPCAVPMCFCKCSFCPDCCMQTMHVRGVGKVRETCWICIPKVLYCSSTTIVLTMMLSLSLLFC